MVSVLQPGDDALFESVFPKIWDILVNQSLFYALLYREKKITGRHDVAGGIAIGNYDSTLFVPY